MGLDPGSVYVNAVCSISPLTAIHHNYPHYCSFWLHHGTSQDCPDISYCSFVIHNCWIELLNYYYIKFGHELYYFLYCFWFSSLLFSDVLFVSFSHTQWQISSLVYFFTHSMLWAVADVLRSWCTLNRDNNVLFSHKFLFITKIVLKLLNETDNHPSIHHHHSL